MLQRLAQATDAFRQGYLSTRMEVTGTLESRAMAETFNDMAGKVQSLVLSLHETQRQQSEQLHFTRQLIDALPLPVFVRHADGTYLDANRAWQRLFQSQPGADGVAGASLPAELARNGRPASPARTTTRSASARPTSPRWTWPISKRPSPAPTVNWLAPSARWWT